MSWMRGKPIKVMVCALVLSLLLLTGVATAGNKTNASASNKRIKNIIVMISDGCGYNHIAAADYYQHGKTGQQVYEKFPVKYGMSTYMVPGSYDPAAAKSDFNYVKAGYTDSAAAATAMSTGVKTYDGAIGVDVTGKPLTHLLDRCENLGKATGVVTSVEWSHATPAGYVAHNASRDSYEQIAQEMVNSSRIDVIMGAGHPWFDKDGKPLSTPNTFKYVGGETTWNSLVGGTAGTGVDADQNGWKDDPWTLVQTRDQFRQLAKGKTPKRVCGTPQVYKTFQQERSGDGNAMPFVVPMVQSVPTLAECTKAALNVLDNDKQGLFLMIEGGAVDWASHANQSGRAIEEEIDFNRAVNAVVNWVDRKSDWNETIVLVTGDHECGYLVGPGSDPKSKPIVNNGKGNLPGMEWHSGDHTNSLIPVFAKGHGANNLRKYADQKDPVRGRYVDNTELAKLLLQLLK